MPLINFDKIPVFKVAHSLTLDVYKLTDSFPKDEKYGLISQLRRSSSSIGANIVEGVMKNTSNELMHFLYTSRASCAETIYHLMLAKDLEYLENKKYNKLRKKAEVIILQLNKWIKAEKNRSKIKN